MLCILHPGFLQFYQKSNHVSLARHVPYEPMLLIVYSSIILWMFSKVFCWVFFSPYFLFPLSTCSVLSQNKVCLELDSLFSKALFFSLLMFEAILAMLCNFSEIIFKGLVFSCALRDVFNFGCLDGCCCFLYFCTMNSKFLLFTFHQPSAFNKDK